MRKLFISTVLLVTFSVVGFSLSTEEVTGNNVNSEETVVGTGVVKFFLTELGWGLITPDGGGHDIFVHHSGTNTGPLNEGDKVSYELEDGPRGAKAVNVSKAG